MGAHWQGIENRMVVEGARYQRELYLRRDEPEEESTDYCENYYCHECPQYGAYCEGREDNDERKQANV